MVLPISRQDEADFPVFQSHNEAADFFKDKFGSDFVFESSENIGDGMCYFYSVVTDHAIYNKGRRLLSAGQPVTGDLGLQFMKSYQPVQIMENGNIHVVY